MASHWQKLALTREGDDLRSGLSLKWMKGDPSIWLTIVGGTPSFSSCCLQMQNEAPASLAVCVPLLS